MKSKKKDYPWKTIYDKTEFKTGTVYEAVDKILSEPTPFSASGYGTTVKVKPKKKCKDIDPELFKI